MKCLATFTPSRIATLLVLLSAIGCASPVKTVLVGDSITEVLGNRGFASGLEVTNVARWGAIAYQWQVVDGVLFGRLAAEMPAPYCTVMLGSNDARYQGYGIPTDKFEDQLRRLVGALSAIGCGRVVLLGPPALMRDEISEKRLVAYRRRIAKICADTSTVSCGPDFSGRFVWPEDYESDGLHPSESGKTKLRFGISGAVDALRRGDESTISGL